MRNAPIPAGRYIPGGTVSKCQAANNAACRTPSRRASSQSALESPEVGEAIWNRTAEGVAQACAITFREGPYSYPDSENWADRKGCVTKRARISGGWRGDLEQDG